MEPVGEKLKRYRLHRGLSKRALAAKLGVSVPTILRWEEGMSLPNDYNRYKIDQLLEGQGPPHPAERPRLVLLSLFDPTP
ncbi:helix-turn-helix transcriptional regulator [Candidatus Bipolaricaulota bacterium]|nr:helix-turn-helix transcriptional regulator [Candidatus Bipolaricaulota bacterium]